MGDSVLSDLEFLLENLNQLLKGENPISCDNGWICAYRDEIELLYDELRLLRILVYDSEESLYEQEDRKSLKRKIKDVVAEAEYKVDSFVFSAVAMKMEGKVTTYYFFPCCPLDLFNVMDDIRSIKADVLGGRWMKKFDSSSRGVKQLQPSTAELSVSMYNIEEDIIVAFDDDELNIAERLTGNQKQLDIISVDGMAGIGKTTLVRKVYNNPLIAYHFSIRAWISVSQVYQKRNLLLGILNSFVSIAVADQIHEMDEQELCDKLFKSLKCYRYLIVMDDIWDARVWNDLKALFPNDNNGSRVILTSRNKNVVSEAIPGSYPYPLRFRTEEESWDLLKRKVFGKDGCCPPGLYRIGTQIAKKCQGLPLAIVVIAGLLRKIPATEYEWVKVATSVSSQIVQDPKMLMDTLALSYTHLPYHLKQCFLYLGAFPEANEIPVRKLIWLWVAEGFISPEGEKSLEDVAEGFLTNLIDRNLVIVAQRRSDGGIKTCCIHDLLREFCSTKAKEESFLQQVYSYEQVSFTNIQHRLFILSHLFKYISLNSCASRVRSILCFAFKPHFRHRENTSLSFEPFKLLRVLDLKSTRMYVFPKEILLLVHLRYLAVWATVERLSSSISNLCNLETLIVKGLPRHTVLPYNIWKMKMLRHIYIEGAACIPCVGEPTDIDNPFMLCKLQTISTVWLSRSNEEVLSRIPNIRKLGCIFSESGGHAFPKLDNLVHLEALKLSAMATISPVNFPSSYKFLSNLKKLSLERFSLPWTEMSTLGKLCNLQVLKLLDNAFKGPRWDTSSGEFLQLKFLKFQGLDIEQWNASSNHFPQLQHLELSGCIKLEGIPYDFSDSCTLEMIKLDCSSPSVVESAMAIQDEKLSMDDFSLKIFVEDGLPLQVQSPTDIDNPFVFCKLQTISTVRLSRSNEEVLSRIRNAFPKLDNLVHLEALKLSAMATISAVNSLSSYKFLSNLKKLSLERFFLPWTEMSTLGKLCNLQVLKLLDNAFKGPRWDTSSGEFLQLKFLKFQGLDIEQWNASSNHFPQLQHLELSGCTKLEGIPFDFSDICTLEMIKLDCSSPSVVESTMAIQDEKLSMDDYSLKIFVEDGLPLQVQSPPGSPPS